MVVPRKLKSRMTIQPSNSASGYIPQGTECRDLNMCLYSHVKSSITHNSYKVEATQVFAGG